MDEGASNRSKALKAAAALGRTPTDEVDELDELDMAHYDDDDEGVGLSLCKRFNVHTTHVV